MDPVTQSVMVETRRQFFGRAARGIGGAALASLLQGANSNGLPHFAPKAKRVIFLYQAGGPSHLETFDPKPKLAEMHGGAAGERGDADRLHHAGVGFAAGLAGAGRAADAAAHDRAGAGVRRPCLDHGR